VIAPSSIRPISQLSEEELLFRDTVRQFAQAEIAPLARAMDDSQQMDAGLIRKLFELGLMGIEIPDEFGGSGGFVFWAVACGYRCRRVDPYSGGVVGRGRAQADIRARAAMAAGGVWPCGGGRADDALGARCGFDALGDGGV